MAEPKVSKQTGDSQPREIDGVLLLGLVLAILLVVSTFAMG